MSSKLVREIVVISGKGGTGKTSLTCAFAALSEKTVLCDLDVDVPDMHIVLKPTVLERTPFTGGNKAVIRGEACVHCGTCEKVCRFGAVTASLEGVHIDPFLCEGCGVCVRLCPEQAIDFPAAQAGEWMISETRFGPFVHACLLPSQENSGKLVALLKREARALASRVGATCLLCDGSPGIGCPVVSSLAGATLAVAVLEPTCSGLHDFQRVAEVCRHFALPLGVVVNRFDLNTAGTEQMESLMKEANVPVFGRVPFSSEVIEATRKGLTVTEGSSELSETIRAIWERILQYRPHVKEPLRHL